jgi:uncharacterized membrane protein YkvA (DUF1232 family)
MKKYRVMINRWKEKAANLNRQVYALYLAYKDARTPWYAKAFTLFVVAYAFSPIDLIPDFIPIVGYLDDLVLIPLGVVVAVKLIPGEVMADCLQKAGEKTETHTFKGIAVVIILIWVMVIAVVGLLVWRAVQPGRS